VKGNWSTFAGSCHKHCGGWRLFSPAEDGEKREVTEKFKEREQDS
jgi:hypothetical protein